MQTPTMLGLALLVGMHHVLEADHVAAVSSLVSGRKKLSEIVSHGLTWGFGHALTLFLFAGRFRRPGAVAVVARPYPLSWPPPRRRRGAFSCPQPRRRNAAPRMVAASPPASLPLAGLAGRHDAWHGGLGRTRSAGSDQGPQCARSADLRAVVRRRVDYRHGRRIHRHRHSPDIVGAVSGLDKSWIAGRLGNSDHRRGIGHTQYNEFDRPIVWSQQR